MPVAGGGAVSQDPVSGAAAALADAGSSPTPPPPPTTPPTPSAPSGPADPNDFLGGPDSGSLNYGIPDTTQGEQFLQEEQAAWAAQGGAAGGNPFAGWTLPAGDAGDFWQLYTQAETFAANTGWKYLPTPAQLTTALSQGLATANSQQVFQYFASLMPTSAQQAMPYAALGMSATQYAQAQENMGDTLYSLTGQTDFSAAGLGAIESTALYQNWTSAQLSDYIQQNPTLKSQYGYLAQGYTYQTFQTYKQQNAQALSSRFGTGYTDANAMTALADPLSSFHASGGAFGQYQPYSPSTENIATGRQSSVR
jgi:hypothetical protein